MVVTLLTSQLPICGLRLAHAPLPPRLEHHELGENRQYMSVIRETSHVLITPYVASAEVGSEHHASRAVYSAALLVKMYELCSSRRNVVGSCRLASGDAEGSGGGRATL